MYVFFLWYIFMSFYCFRIFFIFRAFFCKPKIYSKKTTKFSRFSFSFFFFKLNSHFPGKWSSKSYVFFLRARENVKIMWKVFNKTKKLNPKNKRKEKTGKHPLWSNWKLFIVCSTLILQTFLLYCWVEKKGNKKSKIGK